MVGDDTLDVRPTVFQAPWQTADRGLGYLLREPRDDVFEVAGGDERRGDDLLRQDARHSGGLVPVQEVIVPILNLDHPDEAMDQSWLRGGLGRCGGITLLLWVDRVVGVAISRTRSGARIGARQSHPES
jgi:hypothetical protein